MTLSYLLEQYKIFRSKDSLKLYNFFPIDKELNWFYYFMKHRDIHTPINMFSVYGNRKLMKFIGGKKVFFAGEYLQETTINNQWKSFADHCVSEVNLSMGYDYINHPNYLRFPLWILFFVRPDATFEDIKKKIDLINNPDYRIKIQKTGFACVIASHDTNGIRRKIVEQLNKIELVTCAGKFLNNTQELSEAEKHIQKHYEKADEFSFDTFYTLKKEYLKKFKFNICAENASGKGYVTEKLFDAIESACIPIYWGGGDKKDFVEPEIINPKAFLYYEEGKEDKLIEQVKTLNNDKKEYESFMSIPPFKDTAPEAIWAMLQEFENRLKNL